jgi:hypothetical protein
MRNIMVCLFVCLTFAAVGCSQMVEVKTDFDDDAKFDTFKTFEWVHKDVDFSNVDAKWKMADGYFRDAITKELKAKGITLDAADPDLLVAYSVGMKDKLGHVDFDVDYSENQTNSEIYNTAGGVVIIDLVDADTDHLAWRGEASGAMNVDPSPEIMQKNINKMMKKVFENYPPGQKPLR